MTSTDCCAMFPRREALGASDSTPQPTTKQSMEDGRGDGRHALNVAATVFSSRGGVSVLRGLARTGDGAASHLGAWLRGTHQRRRLSLRSRSRAADRPATRELTPARACWRWPGCDLVRAGAHRRDQRPGVRGRYLQVPWSSGGGPGLPRRRFNSSSVKPASLRASRLNGPRNRGAPYCRARLG